MDGEQLGPRKRPDLPTSRELANEVVRVARKNGVNPQRVIVFGSYGDGTANLDSDADVVVVADFDEDDVYARSYHWDWNWDYDNYPTLDLIPLRPDEFEEFASRDNHIVSTAVETGDHFEL